MHCRKAGSTPAPPGSADACALGIRCAGAPGGGRDTYQDIAYSAVQPAICCILPAGLPAGLPLQLSFLLRRGFELGKCREGLYNTCSHSLDLADGITEHRCKEDETPHRRRARARGPHHNAARTAAPDEPPEALAPMPRNPMAPRGHLRMPQQAGEPLYALLPVPPRHPHALPGLLPEGRPHPGTAGLRMCATAPLPPSAMHRPLPAIRARADRASRRHALHPVPEAPILTRAICGRRSASATSSSLPPSSSS